MKHSLLTDVPTLVDAVLFNRLAFGSADTGLALDSRSQSIVSALNLDTVNSQYPNEKRVLLCLRSLRMLDKNLVPSAHMYTVTWIYDLVRETFDATEIERHEFSSTSFHTKAQVGESVLVLETGEPPSPEGFPGSIYIYVPDVDAAYFRALEMGAQSVAEPNDKPYDERQAGLKA